MNHYLFGVKYAAGDKLGREEELCVHTETVELERHVLGSGAENGGFAQARRRGKHHVAEESERVLPQTSDRSSRRSSQDYSLQTEVCSRSQGPLLDRR